MGRGGAATLRGETQERWHGSQRYTDFVWSDGATFWKGLADLKFGHYIGAKTHPSRTQSGTPRRREIHRRVTLRSCEILLGGGVFWVSGS